MAEDYTLYFLRLRLSLSLVNYENGTRGVSSEREKARNGICSLLQLRLSSRDLSKKLGQVKCLLTHLKQSLKCDNSNNIFFI
jgi:hypothetical protein